MALDDRDEFYGSSEPPMLTPEEMAIIQPYLDRPKPKRLARGTTDPVYSWPHAIKGTKGFTFGTNKQTVKIQCQVPNCPNTREVFVSDLFQVDTCTAHRPLIRKYERRKSWERMQGMGQMGNPMESRRPVSDVLVAEELGGMRPAHLLIKAKNDSSWIEYVDSEGNTKFMQVHDVRSARDAFGRWAVYGVDQKGDPVHELYDLRHGYEHSGTFSGIRELMYGEIVKLAQQGVIRGEDGKEIKTLSGLMQIADEPLRMIIAKKMKEARAGGPSLEDIEKQLFAEPTASSAQKRRTGKAGTRPWPKLMSL